MRVSWTKGRVLTVLMAAVIALQGAGAASAQIMQYGYQDQSEPQSETAQQAWPGYAAQPQTQQPAQRYAAQSQWPGDTARQQAGPQYTAMAYFGDNSVAAESDPPMAAQPISAQAMAAQGCNCQTQAAPTMYQNGYGYQGGCDSGCNYYSTFDRGSGYSQGCYDNNCGNGCLQGCGSPGHRWFGGVYGLLMERDNANYVPLAFSTPTGNAPPYYPTDTEISLSTRNADIGYQGGVEVRFGAYFGANRGGGYGGSPSCDTCGTGSCSSGACGVGSGGCGPSHAWESVYWTIFQDSATTTITDLTTDANRLYSMMDFRGLEYDPGTGYRNVNVWYDYGPPTVDNTAPYDVEVRSFSVRSTLEVHNVEANLLRLPVLCGGGCGSCPPRYELTTLLGARIMRIDEDLWLRSDYERMDTNALGFLAYNVQTDNTLYGFQMGCNGIYRLGCSGRFALHCNSTVGLYGNHIEVTQWMDSPTGGTVRYANGTNDTFYVENDKDDVSVIGELRAGASYQWHSNWRIYGGWRAVGMTGIALATDQIPTAFITPDQVGTIASNGSMILHGLQSGVEFTY